MNGQYIVGAGELYNARGHTTHTSIYAHANHLGTHLPRSMNDHARRQCCGVSALRRCQSELHLAFIKEARPRATKLKLHPACGKRHILTLPNSRKSWQPISPSHKTPLAGNREKTVEGSTRFYIARKILLNKEDSIWPGRFYLEGILHAKGTGNRELSEAADSLYSMVMRDGRDQ